MAKLAAKPSNVFYLRDRLQREIAEHVKQVEAVLEDMLKRVRAGRIPSVLFIAEETGREQPHYGIVGRFRADPASAIGHLAIMQQKVKEWAADSIPGIGDET